MNYKMYAIQQFWNLVMTFAYWSTLKMLQQKVWLWIVSSCAACWGRLKCSRRAARKKKKTLTDTHRNISFFLFFPHSSPSSSCVSFAIWLVWTRSHWAFAQFVRHSLHTTAASALTAHALLLPPQLIQSLASFKQGKSSRHFSVAKTELTFIFRRWSCGNICHCAHRGVLD